VGKSLGRGRPRGRGKSPSTFQERPEGFPRSASLAVKDLVASYAPDFLFSFLLSGL